MTTLLELAQTAAVSVRGQRKVVLDNLDAIAVLRAKRYTWVEIEQFLATSHIFVPHQRIRFYYKEVGNG